MHDESREELLERMGTLARDAFPGDDRH